MAKRPPVELDWFNVSYRSLVRIGVVIVVLAAAGGIYWYQVGFKAPRENARQTIADAEEKLGQARAKVATSPKVAEIVETAGVALMEARKLVLTAISRKTLSIMRPGSSRASMRVGFRTSKVSWPMPRSSTSARLRPPTK